MEVFYHGWAVVQQFIAADAKMPREVNLPGQAQRQVAHYLEERRDFAVIDVIEALGPLSQPELLRTEEQTAALVRRRQPSTEMETGAIIAPIARKT